MNRALIEKIRQCPTLPTLPSIALEVLDMARKEQADIAEIARLISKDSALSSRILRTVNSSFYGRGQSISTISHALVILGLESVKTLVLGFSLVSNLKQQKPRGFKHLAYWRRSVYAATAARTLAAKLKLVQQEEVFLSALLMDIGMLVLDQVLGESYGEICASAPVHSDLAAAEKTALGMHHAEVAGVLAEDWRLPPVLSTPIAMHHEPQVVSDLTLRKLTDVVYIAGLCADVFAGENAADAIARTRAYCHERLRMPENECDEMLDSICRNTQEVAPLFDINIAANTSYEAILKKANEVLVDLTLRSQQQAATLQQQNQKLQEQATTDALTGLANRTVFDAFLAENFATAHRNDRPMSILLIDVDKFKSVNDLYGHDAGDLLLRWLGKVLRSAARAGDLAARYGGEELTLIMPATSRATAAAMAECIRRAIAARPVNVGASQIPVTVSIGVATLERGVPFTSPTHLFKAVDLALYAAKHGGRNCVKIFSLRPDVPAAA